MERIRYRDGKVIEVRLGQKTLQVLLCILSKISKDITKMAAIPYFNHLGHCPVR